MRRLEPTYKLAFVHYEFEGLEFMKVRSIVKSSFQRHFCLLKGIILHGAEFNRRTNLMCRYLLLPTLVRFEAYLVQQVKE